MSVIKVWADGRWSNDIHGLDKVYLIKEAIKSQCLNLSYEDAASSLEGFEINGKPVVAKPDDFADHFFEDFIMDEKELEDLYRGLHLDQAKFFVFPLDVLKLMPTKDLPLSAKYNQIISAAKAPSHTSGYCVLLKFEDE